VISYKIVFTNGKTRTLNSNSILEAYCDSILYALVNKYIPVIKEIIDIKENISYKDFEFNFKSEML
jgi:hypothetical protein